MAGASVQFSVKFDDRRLQKDFRKLHDIDQFRAAAEALNKTRTGIKTDLKTSMVGAIDIRTSAPSKRAARRILAPGGSARATWRRPIAVSLQLYKFVPKIWQFPAGMKPQSIGNGEFIQIMSNGYVGVFKQKGTGQTKRGKARITQVLVDESDISDRQLTAALTKAGTIRWPKEFRRSALRYIQKRL